MQQVAVETTQVLVLADGGSAGAIANKRGHLFEQFTAKLLHAYGYDEPRVEDLNVTSEGIEIDVVSTHRVTKQRLIAECKAYTAHVPVGLVTSFLGKYLMEREDDKTLSGLFVALPRLTAEANEKADAAAAKFGSFRHLGAREIFELLRDAGFLPSFDEGPSLRSDPAIIVTEHGLALAARELDPKSRRARRVVVWTKHSPVPNPLIELVGRAPFAEGLPVVTPHTDRPVARLTAVDPPAIVSVQGSSSDFEYQLPAAPKFFVGRKDVSTDLRARIAGRQRGGSIVINAKSGWGKSSLALSLARETEKLGGAALVVDSRTAERVEFVSAALERLILIAVERRILRLPADAAFSSLASTLTTLGHAEWRKTPQRPLLLFFDQFENVFRDEQLTRTFRDLVLLAKDLPAALTIGFAWKTDLVGWTEDYPYQLRDEIRGASDLVSLEPLGPREIETLLRRLEKAVGGKLQRDLRRQLREYSQGLPWLFKKLAGHVIAELQNGVTQDELVREALNVHSLFESDLAELTPAEYDAVRLIARVAPVPVSELEDSVPSYVLSSLLHKRLVVQVGERIDTYWDTFRDFLVTGRVAVEDSYIIRYGPLSVGKLLRRLMASAGELTVPDAARELGTSATVVFNLSRELRLLGLVTAESNKVAVAADVLSASDPEQVARDRAAVALRRHKIHGVVTHLTADGSAVPLPRLAQELPAAFPAVEAKRDSWLTYARAFSQWLDYAGLAELARNGLRRATETSASEFALLRGGVPNRVKGVFPSNAVGPARDLLLHLTAPTTNPRPAERRFRAALRDLTLLRAVHLDAHDNVALTRGDLVVDDEINASVLKELIEAVQGGREALELLRDRPWAPPAEVGGLLRDANGAAWSESMTVIVGKHFRGWARLAGVQTRMRPPSKPEPA